MLSIAGEYLAEHNPGARLTVFGQELNPESYAICKADMLIKGQDVSNISFGNTLSDDGHPGRQFDYMLSNPPFGVEWKKVEKEVRKEHEQHGFNGRFGPGLPRVSDGSMLFLLHLIAKMRPAKDGGNRYPACEAAGVEPEFAAFDGDNVVSFVLSANLHRRHMTAGQQAAIVASAQDWAKAQPRGGDRKSDQSAILHFDSVEKRAAESGTSIRTQKMADKVAKADPKLAKQVAHGEITLPAAVEKITGKRPGKKKKSTPKAKVAVEPEPEEVGPSEDEIREAEKDAAEELACLRRIAESDDRLAAALAEVKRYRELNRVLEARIRPYYEHRMAA